MTVERDQDFVESVVKALVEKPEKVQVTRSLDEMGVLLELTVDKGDMGVVIGKEGRTAKAIRTLLRVVGAKNDARVNLKIVDPKEDSDSAEEQSIDKKEESASTKDTENSEDSKEEERPLADLEL